MQYVAGAIRNTEPLDYERSHNHILSVVAYDCGMKQSVPVMVTIKVNRICKLGWKGNFHTYDVQTCINNSGCACAHMYILLHINKFCLYSLKCCQ